MEVSQVEKLLSPQQFAAKFNGAIGRNAIYEGVRSNRIRHVRIGKRKILILASEVDEWPLREAQGVEA